MFNYYLISYKYVPIYTDKMRYQLKELSISLASMFLTNKISR